MKTVLPTSPLKNMRHGCASRAEIGKRTGLSHCRDGSGTRKRVGRQAAGPTGPCVRRSGYSLIELVVAVGASTVLMAGMASAILVANQSMEVADGRDGQRIDATGVQQDLLGDIQHALAFTERTDRAVTFLVPDRDGDGDPESLRYAWSGTPSDPLTYEYNGRPPINLAADVHHFDLSYLVQTPLAPVIPEAAGIDSGNLLFVSGGEVVLPSWLLQLAGETSSVNLTPEERDFVLLFTSWGYTVTKISPDSEIAEIEAALNLADVVYVSSEENTANAISFLAESPVGIVNAQPALTAGLGFASDVQSDVESTLLIEDDDHHVTSDFSEGSIIQVLNQAGQLASLTGSVADDLEVLGETAALDNPALVVLNSGDEAFNDSTVPGRRVQIPWGVAGLEQDDLTDAGRTLLRRAFEWASGAD